MTQSLIRLEKFAATNAAGQVVERWIKTLHPDYPAAHYWLCHEARILQEFSRAQRFMARFVAVDTEQRILVTEAPGCTLTQWLRTATGELDHPFQPSSELLRLLQAICLALQAVHRSGVTLINLRPETMALSLGADRRLDYDSLVFLDTGWAHSAQHRLHKPLFADPSHDQAIYLSPKVRRAMQADWKAYARLHGLSSRASWEELGAKAQQQYDDIQQLDVAANHLGWDADLYAVGHWIRQISLHRMDYLSSQHQERIPELLRRMQLPRWRGGFASIQALLNELQTFELSPQSPQLDCAPPDQALELLLPLPAIPLRQPHEMQGSASSEPSMLADELPPTPTSPLRFVGGTLAGLAITCVAAVAWWVWDKQNTPDPGQSQAQPVAVHLSPSTTPPRPTEADRAPTAQTELRNAPEASPGPATPAPTPGTASGQPTSGPTPAASPSGAAAASPPQPNATPSPTSLAALPLPDLRQRAEQGDAAAQAALGLRYRRGEGVAEDPRQAVAWYRKAAEQNHGDGQALLGFMYMTGRGVSRDDRQALTWLGKAARQGHAQARYNLAILYRDARGTPQDVVQAYAWLYLAAEHSLDARRALNELAKRMTPDQVVRAEKLAPSLPSTP